MSTPVQGAVAGNSRDTSTSRLAGIYRYGTAVNSHDLLKVLAIVTMVVDHAGWFFVDECVWMRIVGRMAAPLFFFLVGYSGSYRFKWPILALGVALWAITFLTTPEDFVIDRILPLNILLAFVLIKWTMNRIDPASKTPGQLAAILAVLLLLSAPGYIFIEYGTIGLCYAMGARLLAQRHPFARSWICATVLIHFLLEMVGFIIRNPQATASIVPYAIPCLAAVFALNLAIFLHHRPRTFNVRPSWIRVPALYISRYSLQIYFFHLAAFMIVYRLV